MVKKAASSFSTRGVGERRDPASGARGAVVLRRGSGGHREMLWAAQVWCCTRDLLPHLLRLLVGKEAEKN